MLKYIVNLNMAYSKEWLNQSILREFIAKYFWIEG